MNKEQHSSSLLKKFGKKFFYSTLVFLMALSLFILALPSLASTHWGLSILTRFANSQTSSQATIQKANFSWFGGQTIEGFALTDPVKGVSLNFDKFTTDATLLNLLRYGIKAGESRLYSLNADLKPILEGPSIILEDVDAYLEVPSVSTPLVLNLTGTTRQGKLIGTFDLIASFAQISPEDLLKYAQDTEAFLKDEQQGRIELSLKANNLPVDLLDRLLAANNPRLAGMLRTALGEKIDFSIEEKLANDGLAFLLKAYSPNLSAQFDGRLLPNKFTLGKPAHISFSLQPEFAEWLNKLGALPEDLKFNKPVQTQWDFKQLAFLLDLKTLASPIIQLSSADLKGHLDLPVDLIAQGLGPTLDFTVKANSQSKGNTDLLIGVQSEHFIIPEAHFLLKDDQLALVDEGQIHYQLSSAFANNILLKEQQMRLKNDMGLNIRIKQLEFPLALENLLNSHEIKLKASLNASPLSLTQILQFDELTVENLHFELEGKTLANALAKAGANILIGKEKKIPVSLTIDKLPNLQELFNWPVLELQGLVKLEQLMLNPSEDPHKFIVVDDLVIPWELNGPKNELKVSFTGKTKMGQQESLGSLNGKIDVNQWLKDGQLDLSEVKTNAQINLVQLPVKLLAALINQPDLTGLLGNTLDLKLTANLPSQDHAMGHVYAQLIGQGIEANGFFNVQDVITLNNPQTPASLRLNLTPERFSILRKWLSETETSAGHDLTLLEDAGILVELTSLNLPWKNHSLSQMGLDARVAIDKLKVVSRSGEKLDMDDISASITSPALANIVNFNIHAKQSVSDLTFTGSMENAFDKNGDFNTSQLSFKLDSKLTHFPASLVAHMIDPASKLADKIDALFGKTLDADLHAQLIRMEGPLQAELKGKNGYVSLNARIANNMLMLNQDFHAEFTQSPELGKAVMQNILPLLSGIIKGEQPLKIWLSKEGFHLPIRNFSLDQVAIGQALLDMGKVEFSNTGQLASVLKVLNIAKSDNIPVWFTPLYLNMSGGLLNIYRLDMLISDRYPIATWGKVDFVKDKVKLMVGLTGKALTQAFNIQGLENDYILQLPLTGKLGNASIDTATATAKISAIIAQSQGPQGVVIGAILHIASGGLGEEKAPAPTTNPLPWQNQMEGTKAQAEATQGNSQEELSSTSSPGKKRKKKDHNPMKQVENEANSLLENIFH